MVRTALVAPRPAASTSRVFLGRSATAIASTRSLHLGWKAAFPSRITSTLEVATANGLQLRVVLRRPFHTAKRVGKYEITLPPVPVKVSALDRVWWVADKALGSGWLVVFGAYYFISDKKNGSWLPNLGNYVYEGVLQYAPSAVVALLEAFEAKNSAHGLDAKFAVVSTSTSHPPPWPNASRSFTHTRARAPTPHTHARARLHHTHTH